MDHADLLFDFSIDIDNGKITPVHYLSHLFRKILSSPSVDHPTGAVQLFGY